VWCRLADWNRDLELLVEADGQTTLVEELTERRGW
jgi:hypothetical protein